MKVKYLLLLLMGSLLLGGCAGKDAVRPDADNLLDLRREAASLYQDKEYAAAMPLYLQLVERVPNDAVAWFRVGNIHARQNQPEKAIEAYQRAVLLDPTLSRAWHNIGIIRLRQAANSFTQSLEYIPPADPMFDREMRLSEGVLELLKNGRPTGSP